MISSISSISAHLRPAGCDRRPRRATTLVEVLVALLIGGMALTLMWALYVTGHRQSRKLEGRLTAAQGVQLLVERMRQDITQTIFAPGDPRPLVESARGGRSNVLNLLVFQSYRYLDNPGALADPGENDSSWIRAQRVRYLFDPASRKLSRATPRAEETLGFARFCSVRFTPNHLEAHAISPENSVTVELECPPDDDPAGGRPGDPRNTRVPIVLPLQSYAHYLTLDWSPNWFDLSVQVEESAP